MAKRRCAIAWSRDVVQPHSQEEEMCHLVAKRRCATSWSRDLVQPRGQRHVAQPHGREALCNPAGKRRGASSWPRTLCNLVPKRRWQPRVDKRQGATSCGRGTLYNLVVKRHCATSRPGDLGQPRGQETLRREILQPCDQERLGNLMAERQCAAPLPKNRCVSS